MCVVLETERLQLRKITTNDAQDFFELDSNPNVHKYLGKTPVNTIEESEEAIAAILGQYERYNLGRSAVILKDSGEFIGWSGLKYETTVRDYAYYDIGYRFKEQFWGKGYAKESAIASLKYGFENLGLPKICGGAEVDNIASNKILKGIGLQYVETFDFEDEPHHWYELENNKHQEI